jgi:glycosyltransferase involved in cell wall biosynthesis
MGVSAVLIVKNEEAVIGRCIKSLLGLDEIAVLDTGSTDNTVKIARDLGARVATRSPDLVPFHFGQARNEALALASQEWIFSMDADEVLRPGGIRKILHAVEEAQDRTAYLSAFINQAEGGSVTRTFVIQKIKLFKASEWEWKYRVHEQLVPRNPDKRKIGILEGVSVEHLPVPDKSKRHGQNVDLLRMTVKENPEYTRAFRHLGQELMLRKEWREAVPFLAEYAEKTDEGPLHKSEALMHIGRCYAESGGLDKGLKWFDMAFKEDPRRREPLFHAALNLIKACRLDEAKVWAKRMMDVPVATRPNSPLDLEDVWGATPLKMYMFCQTEIANAKAKAECLNG